jgi:Domain of unknown function (DUF6883)
VAEDETMRIPADAIISPEKITRYLLVPRAWDDKSQFLARAGFAGDDPDKLELAIRRLTGISEAADDGENEYGTFYRIVGELDGPNGVSLPVVLIWLQWKSDGTFHFVTLKPDRNHP